VALLDLLLVRHAESVGNQAREAAEAEQSDRIGIDERDPDVDLTGRGREQAEALGRRLAELPPDDFPTNVWASPYLRAQRTATIALATAGSQLDVQLDERLRDRELGQVDLLTRRGVHRLFPEEEQRRRHLGKMYYRPAGGESWADVALRLRSFLGEIDGTGTPSRVLVVSHDAVVLLVRYVLERMTESEVLDLASRQSVGNASITRLVRPEASAPWTVLQFGEDEHLTRFGAVPTEHGAERDVHPK
jgi:broad specificity phosphatase PhoE